MESKSEFLFKIRWKSKRRRTCENWPNKFQTEPGEKIIIGIIREKIFEFQLFGVDPVYSVDMQRR